MGILISFFVWGQNSIILLLHLDLRKIKERKNRKEEISISLIWFVMENMKENEIYEKLFKTLHIFKLYIIDIIGKKT